MKIRPADTVLSVVLVLARSWRCRCRQVGLLSLGAAAAAAATVGGSSEWCAHSDTAACNSCCPPVCCFHALLLQVCLIAIINGIFLMVRGRWCSC